jgi:hypothetical protein
MLVLVAFVMPQVLLLPRGFLLGWLSSLLHAFVVLVPLALGWCIYRFFAFNLLPSDQHGTAART